jgi:hypothetical protein
MSKHLEPDYPTEPHGNIPAFNSYEEEADFWDTHDFTDKRPLRQDPVRAYTKQIMFRVDSEMDSELEVIAHQRGLKKASLIRMALKDWLRDEHRNAS